MREVLGMSPDVADALALTCMNKYTLDDPVMAQERVVSGVTKEEEMAMMSED